MKKTKVLRDLQTLMDNIESGKAEVRKYEYEFDNYEYEYGDVDDDVECYKVYVKVLDYPEDR